jgi:hypothetical protein
MYGRGQAKATPRRKYAIDYSENDDICVRIVH